MDPFLAIINDNIDELKEYLLTGNINIVNAKKQSLVHLAIMMNNQIAFSLLLDNGIDFDLPDENMETPVLLCVKQNRLGFLKTLIRLEADIDSKDSYNETPLYRAIKLDRLSIIDCLLEKQELDYNLKNANGENIYFAIVRSNDLNLMTRFLRDKRDLFTKNNSLDSLLHVAVSIDSLSMTRFLLENGLFSNQKNKLRETPIFNAIRHSDRAIINVLINYGARLEYHNIYLENLLELANDSQTTQLLEEKLVDKVYYTYPLLYPLHYAIQMENANDCVKAINIRNINRTDAFGHNPIDLAFLVGNERIIRLLKTAKIRRI